MARVEICLLLNGGEYMKLIENNSDIPLLNEVWTVEFYDHKPLSFASRQDLEKYLNHECSDEHGYMDWGRVPSGVSHTIYYNIDYEDRSED